MSSVTFAMLCEQTDKGYQVHSVVIPSALFPFFSKQFQKVNNYKFVIHLATGCF